MVEPHNRTSWFGVRIIIQKHAIEFSAQIVPIFRFSAPDAVRVPIMDMRELHVRRRYLRLFYWRLSSLIPGRVCRGYKVATIVLTLCQDFNQLNLFCGCINIKHLILDLKACVHLQKSSGNKNSDSFVGLFLQWILFLAVKTRIYNISDILGLK